MATVWDKAKFSWSGSTCNTWSTTLDGDKLMNDSTITFEENAENYERISAVKNLDLSYNSIDRIPDKLKKIGPN